MTRNSFRFRFALAAVLLAVPLTAPLYAQPVDTAAVQPRQGWYRTLVDFDAVRASVDIPPKKGVAIVDSRPAARQFDPGHIPGAINVPDSQFDKLADRLPADRSTRLVFYCGGVDCMLSHQSAFKAERLGYTAITVYAAGMPDWKARGGPVAVSAAYIEKLIDEKADVMLVDARPRRVADKGMIPTAVNIPDTEFDRLAPSRLPVDKATSLIFYCGGLDCVLSDKSAEKARKLGYANVFTYPEGYPEWVARHGAEQAVVAAAAAPPSTAASLIAGKEKGSVTVASFEAVWRSRPDALLLVDVRAAKEFAAGTIKGATNIAIDDLEGKVGTLPTDRPVVFFCGTGARAGEAYDMVRLLKPEIQAHFLDADVKFAGDGGYSVTQK